MYKGFLCDFYFKLKQVEYELISKEAAIEYLRQRFVQAGRQGKNLLINLGEAAPDLIDVYSDPALFSTSKAFDHNEWRKSNVHMAVLKEGENYSMDRRMGGLYYLDPGFTI